MNINRQLPVITGRSGHYGSISTNVDNNVVRIDYYSHLKPRAFVNGVRYTKQSITIATLRSVFDKMAVELNWVHYDA